MKIKIAFFLILILIVNTSCSKEEVPTEGDLVVKSTWVRFYYYRSLKPIDEIQIGLFDYYTDSYSYYYPDNARLTGFFTDGEVKFFNIPAGTYVVATIGGGTKRTIEIKPGKTRILRLFD